MNAAAPPSEGGLCYELRLGGHLDNRWDDSVAELTMTHEPDGTTTLRAPGLDQAALHGLLTHVRDLGVTLISVMPVICSEGNESPGQLLSPAKGNHRPP